MENQYEVCRIVEVKEGKKYVEQHRITDAAAVYDCLAHDLIAKKINCCTWIKSIRRVNNYNGTQTITVQYDNDCRAKYIVSDH